MPKLKTKSKCCKDKPRCKKCPVVLKRLADAGYAKRLSHREYAIEKKVPGKQLATARAR